MDFNTLCKFLTRYAKHFKNKRLLLPLLKDSFASLKLKRQKLKTGSVSFSFKTLKVDNIVLSQWFEIEYKSQPTASQNRKEFEKKLSTLSLKKDVETFFFLLTILLIFFFYINSLIEFYITSIVFPAALAASNSQLTGVLFSLIFTEPSFLINTLSYLANNLVDMAIL